MVGLSIILEGQKGGGGGGGGGGSSSKRVPQVINKTTMVVINKPSPFPSSSSSLFPSPLSPSQTHKNFPFHSSHSPFLAPTFLDQCFLCKQKLLPGKDIYMYKGDRGFCSVECRYRQIFMDEEESVRKEMQYCSFSAMKPTSASSSSSSAASNQRKGARKRVGLPTKTQREAVGGNRELVS